MDIKDFASSFADRLAILRVIDEWVFYRDSGIWESLRRLFSADGRMTTNSTSSTADEFIAYGRQLREMGLLSHHFPGPSLVRVNGDKALVETVATLMVRATVHGTEVDVWVLLRYLDRFVREESFWRIQDRHPIYIKDRMDPVMPGSPINFDAALLQQCPAGCRYLIYLGRANGAPASLVVPTVLGTPAAAQILQGGEAWLAA